MTPRLMTPRLSPAMEFCLRQNSSLRAEPGVNVTELSPVGTAHPTADQGFWPFARINFTLIQCHSNLVSLQCLAEGGDQHIPFTRNYGIQGCLNIGLQVSS
jgi:hypothetical protein